MKDRIIIGIAGASGSGKTLIAHRIAKIFNKVDLQIISEDAFYRDLAHLDFNERVKTNFDHPSSFDHDALIAVLKDIKKGLHTEIPIYDYANHTRKQDTICLDSHRVTILEGILIFHDPRLRDMMDIKLFVDTAADICLLRRIKRDTLERGRSLDSILDQYEKTVRPMFMEFVEPSKLFADIIIPRGGENQIAIDMIQSKLKQLLGD